MEKRRYVMICDLLEDSELIEAYKRHHQEVWPEIIESIRGSGILSMEIYNYQTRLVMIMEVSPEFSFEEKKRTDAENEAVGEWEALMWKYQKAIPGAGSGEKWVLMDQIFNLNQV